jgi:hypothetical protein
MRTYRVGIAGFAAALLILFMAGCGKEVANVPTVISTVAAQGATGVAVNTTISATFSEVMSPATLNATTFTVTGPGGVAVPGAVTYGGTTAIFTPATALAYGTLYTGTITTGASTPGGACLIFNYVWTFTTITPAPVVAAVVSPNGAMGVPINQVLSATFTEAMNPATLNATTFTVTGPGGTIVSGAVAYAGLVATFTPTINLAYNALYTATITTGAEDLAGTGLTSNYVWSFTTITPAPTVTAVVPANGATGVPVNQVLSATFNETMSPATISTATFTVIGSGGVAVPGAVTYAGTVATFTPTISLAYNTIYTATITTGAKDLAATPLAANYVWSFTTITPAPVVTAVVPANGAIGVPINQVLSATFSEAMSPATITAATFTVTGPGGVAVPGAITYSGLVATFTPTASLADSTTYTATITTGAKDLAGTPLAANYVWTFTTISPTPAVIVTTPVNEATAVPISQVLSTTFNETMSCATLTSATFTVTGPGTTAVAGTVSCAGSIATFTPSALLTVNTLYTATITTGVKDLAGTAMASNFVWSFLTVPAPTPPTVISTVPVNGATGVPINQAVTATFSVAMNAATIDSATFTLSATGGASVTGVVTYVAAGSIATFTPNASLASSTQYTVTITTGAIDLTGTGLASNCVWTFTTAAAPVVIPPTVISTIPANGATNVPFNQAISATFSTAMNPATISSSTFTLTGSGTAAISGLVAYAAIGNTLTFIPSANLAPGTLFTATITTGAQNLAGVALTANYVWTFTTGAAPAVTPPEVASTVPVNGATNVPLNQAVSATFTEAMNPLTITTATFLLTGPGGISVAGTVSYDAIHFIATLTPSAPLTASTTYTADVTTGATDLAGNPLGTTGAPNPWSFTTITPAPLVTAVVPANGATGVPINQLLSATFTETMSCATLTSTTFTVTGPGATAVAGTVS